MRAEVLGLAGGRFEVAADPAPAEVEITLRPCWQKPPVRLRLAYLYTDERAQVAYYAIVEGS